MSQESFEDIRFESLTLNSTINIVVPFGRHNHNNHHKSCQTTNKKAFYRIMGRMALSTRFVLCLLIILTFVCLACPHKHHNMSTRRRQPNRSRTIFHLITGTHLQTHRKPQAHRHPYYFHYDHDDNAGSKVQHIFRRWTPNVAQTPRQSRARIEKTVDAKVLYQLNRITSDEQLPVCDAFQVCNKIDTYSSPWIEKQCRCAAGFASCSQSLSANDGHTIAEKSTRQYKICEPVRKLPTCRFFRDITWTITTTEAKSESSLNALLMSNDDISTTPMPFSNEAENITRQEMKCQCPPNSVAYISKHQVYKSPDGQLGYRYSFACSPETKLRCRRKEPCRLFTARKRPKVEEVTTNTLCQCGVGYTCPTNHRHASVLLGTSYPLDNIKTYSGYCHPDPSVLPVQDEDETGEGVTELTGAQLHNRQYHLHHHKSDDSLKSLRR